jgi:hypothetical protein
MYRVQAHPPNLHKLAAAPDPVAQRHLTVGSGEGS